MAHHGVTPRMHDRLDVQPQLTLLDGPVQRTQSLDLQGRTLILGNYSAAGVNAVNQVK
jgi:hypothetical protein